MINFDAGLILLLFFLLFFLPLFLSFFFSSSFFLSFFFLFFSFFFFSLFFFLLFLSFLSHLSVNFFCLKVSTRGWVHHQHLCLHSRFFCIPFVYVCAWVDVNMSWQHVAFIYIVPGLQQRDQKVNCVVNLFSKYRIFEKQKKMNKKYIHLNFSRKHLH